MEERRAEPEGDTATHHHERQIERVAHHGRRPPDDFAGSLHDLERRLGRRTSGDRVDRHARGLGIQAPLGTAMAPASARLDDDVADLAGLTRLAVEEVTVEYDGAGDAARHGDREEVRMALRCTEPPLGECQRLGVEVAVHGESRQFLQTTPQGEVTPRRSADRRHQVEVAGDQATAADADPDNSCMMSIGDLRDEIRHHTGECGVVRLRSDVDLDRRRSSIDEDTSRRHQARLETVSADVDGENHVGGTRRVGGDRVARCDIGHDGSEP